MNISAVNREAVYFTNLKNIENQNDARKQEKNLLRFHGEAAASAVEDAAVGYQAPSVIAVGANAQSVSLLAMLVNLSLSLVSFKAPAIIEKLGVTKRGSVILALSNMLTWMPLAVIFLLSQFNIAPALVAFLWLINIMPGMLLSFQKDNWLSNMVPQQVMGKYLGKRLAVKSGFYLAAFFAFGYLMDTVGENSLFSFGLVFIIATTATLIYSLIYSQMHDPKKQAINLVNKAAEKIKFGLKDYFKDLKAKRLDKFVYFTSLINVSIGLSAPFYAVYMLQEQSFSYMSYTIIIAVEFLARIISGPFWGKFADRKGNIQVLKIISRIIPALPICWLFSTNIAYLAVIQIISGICWGAFDLSTQSYLYKVAPQTTKLHYIVYTRSLMLFSVAMGGLAGAFLVNNVFEIFGSKLLTVIMISGFLRAGIVMFLMPKLIDLAVKYGIPLQAKINLALTKKATLKHGLFYHMQEKEAFQRPSNVIDGSIRYKRNPAMEQRLMEAQAAKKQLELLTETVKAGRRRNWALEAASIMEESGVQTKKCAPVTEENEQALAHNNAIRRDWVIKGIMGKLQKEVTTPAVEPTQTRRPWYGDAGIMANYQAKVPAMTSTNQECTTMSVGKTITREGLFYNGKGWARYKEESLQAVIRDRKASKAGLSYRKNICN